MHTLAWDANMGNTRENTWDTAGVDTAGVAGFELGRVALELGVSNAGLGRIFCSS